MSSPSKPNVTMSLPAYADIGKAPKELLSGGKAGGAFQFDPKLTFSSKTSTGVTFTATAVSKATLDATLKAAYATKKYTLDVTLDPRGKIVTVNGSLSDVAPGVKLGLGSVLTDPSTAKASLDYVHPYFNLKSSVGLKASPTVDVSVGTGYQNIVLGADTSYDTAAGALAKYNLGAAYHAPDFQVAAFLEKKFSSLKLAYSHNLNAATTVGAEVVYSLPSADAAFSLAYAKKLSNGALAKTKLDNAGLLSVLYETRLTGGEKVSGSLQLQATDFSKPPKYGFAVDLA